MRIRLTRRRDAALVAALPDVLERVAGGLRAGASPLAALTDAAAGADLPPTLSADLSRVVQRAGRDGLEAALAAWVDERPPATAVEGSFRRRAGRRPPPPVSAVAAALQVAAGAGGPAATALDGLASALRDGHDTAGEVAALSAQARLSAIVVGAAPFVSLTLSLAVDRRVAPALVGSPSGRTCLLVGLASEALAALWMRRIVRCEP